MAFSPLNFVAFTKIIALNAPFSDFLNAQKRALDHARTTGAVLMDLSKGFDCLNHVLMIEKLEAYGFAKEALTLMHNYLQERR